MGRCIRGRNVNRMHLIWSVAIIPVRAPAIGLIITTVAIIINALLTLRMHQIPAITPLIIRDASIPAVASKLIIARIFSANARTWA